MSICKLCYPRIMFANRQHRFNLKYTFTQILSESAEQLYIYVATLHLRFEIVISLQKNILRKCKVKSFAQMTHILIFLVYIVCLFIIFRNTQQFFSNMMAVSFYWWKSEPRYIIQCIGMKPPPFRK
jgi:hypothetical protein